MVRNGKGQGLVRVWGAWSCAAGGNVEGGSRGRTPSGGSPGAERQLSYDLVTPLPGRVLIENRCPHTSSSVTVHGNMGTIV